MFYDLEQPGEFVADIARSLADEGIWVSEFSYMPTMLEKSSFDTICHEHLEYYSVAVIERLLGDAGLEIVRAELNDVNGGSIRIFAGHAGRHDRSSEDATTLQQLREREAELELATAAPYETFARRALKVRDDLTALLRTLRARRCQDPCLRRLDEGKHHPSIRRYRPVADRVRSGPEPGQMGIGDDRYPHSDPLGGGIARTTARLLPRASLAFPRRVPGA